MSRGRTLDGGPLTPGVNVDAVDVAAGLAAAHAIGYEGAENDMVTVYALQRWQRGEEDGAERTWLSHHPRALTQWRYVLAHAVAGQ